MAGEEKLQFYVGSYATLPKKAADLEAEYYEGLASLPRCSGLELGLTVTGEINAAHANSEAWLLERLKVLGQQRNWHYVLTAVTQTMGCIEKDPHFGLASDDPRGRAAAVMAAKDACSAVARLNVAAGAGACKIVELQSGPVCHTTAAKAAGVSSSAKSLAASLTELQQLDWQGAMLVIEHCDSYLGIEPVKGFMPLEADLEALKEVGKTDCPKVLLTVNWARSVLETHDPATAAAHISSAKEVGMLGGLMLSGCSGVEGPYGRWKDTHMPHGHDVDIEHYAEGSLLTRAEIQRCFSAGGGAKIDISGNGLAYVGIKISAKHLGEKDVTGRIRLIADMLDLVAASADAEQHCDSPAKKLRVEAAM